MRWLYLSFIIHFIGVGFTQQIVRGPYLQVLTPNSIEVAWITNEPTDSRVIFGDSVHNQFNHVADLSPKTNHFLTLNNLESNKTYFYSIGSSESILLGNSESFRFKTAPHIGTPGAFRFWVIGDFGRGSQGQVEVLNSFIQFQNQQHTDFMIWLGDNAYPNGTQQEYQNNLFNVYDSILHYTPVFSTPGNHDYNSVNRYDPPLEQLGPYFDIINSPIAAQAGGVPSNTELFYSFDFGNIHFISLNSEIPLWTTDANSPMYHWLEQDLMANDQDWIVCYFHQPPYSKANHDSDNPGETLMTAMRQNALPILEKYHVDLVLCGHSHVYERSKMIHGHYGLSSTYSDVNHAVSTATGNFDQGAYYVKYPEGSNTGTVYVVCGNSGSSDGNCQLTHPVMISTDCGVSAFGSLVLDVNNNRLDCKYLKSNGLIHDEFTIIKQPGLDTTVQFSGLTWLPNPTQHEFTINFIAQQSFEFTRIITDASGKEILKEILTSTPGINTFSVDIKNLSDGVFHVQLISYKEKHTFSLVKKE